jgi:hypothetical protein
VIPHRRVAPFSELNPNKYTPQMGTLILATSLPEHESHTLSTCAGWQLSRIGTEFDLLELNCHTMQEQVASVAIQFLFR